MYISLLQSFDSQIMEGILKGGRERQKYENKLYDKYRYFINEGIKKYQLEEYEAASAYSDTILAIIDQITTQRFEGRSSLKTFAYQIFSNQCVSLLRKKTTNKASATYDTVLLSEIMYLMTDHTQNIVQKMIEHEEENTLLQRLDFIGKKCKELLMLWANGLSDKDIVIELAYSSADVVKVSRMRCMKKLRENY